MTPDLLPERIANRIKIDDNGCWIWSGALKDGYGSLQYQRRQSTAHRRIYEILVGEVAPELEVDHTCRVRNCVNPEHLEPVTPRENTLRSNNRAAINARKTHCDRGHEFTPENTRLRPKRGVFSRRCIACKREDDLRYYYARTEGLVKRHRQLAKSAS